MTTTSNNFRSRPRPLVRTTRRTLILVVLASFQIAIAPALVFAPVLPLRLKSFSHDASRVPAPGLKRPPFPPWSPPSTPRTRTTVLSMRSGSTDSGNHHHHHHHHRNWFQKALEGAFANEAFAAPPEGVQATARHILVHTPRDCDMVLDQLQHGQPFGEVAHRCSVCPSKAHGGSLGRFGPGTMVAEFDAVVFDPHTPLGQVVGPIQTDFGYHFIVVDRRTGL